MSELTAENLNEMEQNLNSQELNGTELVTAEEQNGFLDSTLGKVINTAVDLGLRWILPDFIENQIIEVKDTLITGGLKEGIVLDHITAGKSMDIYHHLGLDKLDCEVAIIKNARSNKMGRKDIIKIAGNLEHLDLDVLGYIDHNITVNIIKDGHIAEKKTLKLPRTITNVIHCKNPRCITSIEQELPHVFKLADEATKTYRCLYCEEKYGK